MTDYTAILKARCPECGSTLMVVNPLPKVEAKDSIVCPRHGNVWRYAELQLALKDAMANVAQERIHQIIRQTFERKAALGQQLTQQSFHRARLKIRHYLDRWRHG